MKVISEKIKSEFRSFLLFFYLGLILSFIIFVCIYHLAKTYATFIQDYDHQLIFSVSGFGSLGIFSYFLLMSLFKKRDSHSTQNQETSLNQVNLTSAIMLFVEGFTESIIKNVSQTPEQSQQEKYHEQGLQ